MTQLMYDAAFCAAWLLIAVALRLWVLSFARIKGHSMASTLRDGEWTFVWRLPYRFRTPRRHEVVICHFPRRRWKKCRWIPQAFVKRVIGLPGDTLEVTEGVLRINGEALEEPYLEAERCRFLRDRAPVTLGPDEYFVMGDNRDRSSDSRRMGPIRRRDIRGRVLCVFLPIGKKRRIR